MAKIDLPKNQILIEISDEMKSTRVIPEDFSLLYPNGKSITQRDEYLSPVRDPYEEEEYREGYIAQGEVEEKHALGDYSHHVTYEYYLPLQGSLIEIRERLGVLLLYAVNNPHRNLVLSELCRNGKNPKIRAEDIADIFIDAPALKNLFMSEELWKAVIKLNKSK